MWFINKICIIKKLLLLLSLSLLWILWLLLLLALFLLSLLLLLLLLLPLSFINFFVDVRVCSIAVENRLSSNLTLCGKSAMVWGQSPGILPWMAFIPGLLWRAPPNEHRVLSLGTLRILSLNYDEKKHSLPSIFIDREESIMASGKRSRSTAVTFGKCFSLNIAHEFLHSSAFLVI